MTPAARERREVVDAIRRGGGARLSPWLLAAPLLAPFALEWLVRERRIGHAVAAFANFLFDPFQGGVKGMLTSFSTALRRMAAEAASAEILRATGLTGFITTAVGSLFGGGKALGGPVSGGTSYLVGERGPELFTPGASGAITPNDKLGGVTYAPNLTFNIDSRSDRMQVIADIKAITTAQQREFMYMLARNNPGIHY